MNSLQKAQQFFKPSSTPGLPTPQASSVADREFFDPNAPGRVFSEGKIQNVAERLEFTNMDRREAQRTVRGNITADPLGVGLVNTEVEHGLGTGLILNPQIDREFLGINDSAAEEWEQQAEAIANHFFNSPFSSSSARFDFNQNEELVFRNAFIDGDSFLLINKNPTPSQFPYKFTVQFVPSLSCSNPNYKSDTDSMTGGVEFDENQRPRTYYFIEEGYTEARGIEEWTPRKAFDGRGLPLVVHCRMEENIGEIRPLPPLMPIVNLLRSISNLTDAELTSAVHQAFLAVATKTEGAVGLKGPSRTPGSFSRNNPNLKVLETTKAMHIPLGERDSIELLSTNRPNPNLGPFLEGMISHLGVGTGIPRELLLKTFQASYSASRAAIELAKAHWKRRRMIAARVRQAVYERIIWDSVLDGILVAPGFVEDFHVRRAYLGSYKEQWIGNGFPVIDEGKEVEGNIKAEGAYYKTAQQATSELTGGSWNRNVSRARRELEKKAELAELRMKASGIDTEQQDDERVPNNDRGDRSEDDDE